MNQVKLMLKFSNNLAYSGVYDVAIYDRAHNQIFHTRTTSNLCVCCACGVYLIQVSLNYENETQTISRFVDAVPCCLMMNFNFYLKVELLQTFVLLDKNYNLPINKAILSFTPRS